MKKILIADSSKASLVMTSEVFKDHFPGVHVLVARTSAEALEIAKREEQVDAFVVDLDLPDRDGAYTAARIKKLFPVPVLITAFDRPEVQTLIEKHCSAYDDCLSWLAKPVNAELVVSIAQRFIEGNYRTQRRIDCLIPGMTELVIGKRTKKAREAAVASGEQLEKLCLPMMLEDCSVGGFKFRLMRKTFDAHKELKVTPEGKVNIDTFLTVYLPSFESIQTGEDNVGYWLWGDDFDSSAASSDVPQTTRRTRTSLSTLRRSSRQSLGNKSHEGQAIKGKVMWMTPDGDDVLIGVQSENLVLSKKLFESIVIGDSRMRNRRATVESQKDLLKGYHAGTTERVKPQLEVITGSFKKSNSPTTAQPQLTLVDASDETSRKETKKTPAPKAAAPKKSTPQPELKSSKSTVLAKKTPPKKPAAPAASKTVSKKAAPKKATPQKAAPKKATAKKAAPVEKAASAKKPTTAKKTPVAKRSSPAKKGQSRSRSAS